MLSMKVFLLGFTLAATVCFGAKEVLALPYTPEHLVYVFGSEGIDIIDPRNKEVLYKITDGICTKSNNRFSKKNCSFGGVISVKDALIFFSDTPGNRVHVIDVEKQKVKETIATGGYPYDLYYLHWLEEVWVHTWKDSTFDVINTAGSLRKTHTAIKAHVQPGWTHGYMYADQQIKKGKVGYVTHMFNPGIHKLDLSSKTYKDFVNVSNYGCRGTFNFAYSLVNKHGFSDCFGSKTLLEFDMATDQVVRSYNFTGVPYASKNGRFIVTLYKSVNESTNVLLASEVVILTISNKDSPPNQNPTIKIPGGVSKLVFDPNNITVAFISLVYLDKIAVLDLSSLQVSYIDGVGSVLTAPGMHSVSRSLVVAGPWIATPATANNTVAVINMANREVEGMVQGVVQGLRAIAVRQKVPVPSSATEFIHFSPTKLIFTVLFALQVTAG